MSTSGQIAATEGGTSHAVVIGGSMAGLAVAKALTARFHRVTVLERDWLGDEVQARPGVPQGRHLHALLPRGVVALERLFPGLTRDLVADGAVLADHVLHQRWVLNGRRLARGTVPTHDVVLASRPFVESHVRRHLRREPRITIAGQHVVRGLITTAERRRVTGVRVAGPTGQDEHTIAADLVVDCSGRRSRLPTWLVALGYAPPSVDRLEVDLHYASCHYQLPEDTLDGDLAVLIAPPSDGVVRGGAMFLVEADRWLVTLGGMGGERPPLDPEAFERFAGTFIAGDLHAALTRGRPLDEPVPFRYPASVRHRYERLRSFPENLLAAGDAVCSFNPLYGQGMTVAAVEAELLRDRLASGRTYSAREWFEAIRSIVDVPWNLVVAGDLAVPQVQGRRSLKLRLLNRYVVRLQATAEHDPALTARFLAVAGLMEPPERLLAPAVVARVLRAPLPASPPGDGAGAARTDRVTSRGRVLDGAGAARTGRPSNRKRVGAGGGPR